MIDRYNTAVSIIQKLTDRGYTAYIAGGWVRDYLMQHPSDDIDIATDAPIEELPTIFSKTIPVGALFGILVVVENGFQYEVATFRKEEGYHDGRRPSSVEPATPEEDAKRRDFTINGMFYDPLNEKIYDYVNGQADIEKEVIRAIGNPHERFQEDRLRMIRAVRYATRFHFAIDPATIQAILAHSKELFPAVAIERVVQEFLKMRDFGNLQEGLLSLFRLQLLQQVFPNLKGKQEQTIKTHLKHIVNFPKKTPIIAFILELFPHATQEEKIALAEDLKLSKQEKNFALLLDKMDNTLDDDLTAWAYLYADPASEMAKKVHVAKHPHTKSTHDQRSTRLTKAIANIRNNTPVVQSSHLLKRGVSPGKEMGSLLRLAESIAIENDLHDPEEVLGRLPL